MVNKVILIGNVGMDPEVRALEGGAKVARLRIATTERIYNRQTQTATEHTEWHTVTLWRGLADVADRYVRKGSQVYIEGSLRTREWTDKDNNKRYTTEIVANDMKLLGRRAEGAGAPMDGSTYGAAPRPAAAAPAEAPSGAAQPFSGGGAAETCDGGGGDRVYRDEPLPSGEKGGASHQGCGAQRVKAGGPQPCRDRASV